MHSLCILIQIRNDLYLGLLKDTFFFLNIAKSKVAKYDDHLPDVQLALLLALPAHPTDA